MTTEDTSITIENLTPRTQYYIQVIATRDNAQDGTPSIESNIHTLAPPPDVTDNVSLSGFNANTIHVSWSSVTDANYYKVQWKTGTQEYDVSRQLLIQHPATTASIGSLNANTLYYVQVITHITGAEDSAGVEESITTPSSGAPDRVTGVTITNVTWTSLTVSWSPISSADGYILQWSTTSGTYDNTNSSRLTGANNTSAGIQSLTENTTYYIQVTAFSGGINGTASVEVSTTTEYQTPGPVTGVSASPTSNGTEISVSWTAAARATGYEIRWSTTSGSYGATWQGSCSSCTSYTITSPTLGNTYYIQVRATRTSADEGEPSTEISILFANAAQVTNVTVVANSDTELEVTWNASDRADGYKLQWRLSSGTYGSTNQITTTTATEATITSLVASTTYYIRVIATRTDYPDAVPSVETSRTTLGPPPGKVANVVLTVESHDRISVTWDAVSGATGYKIQWRETGGTFIPANQATSSGTSGEILGLLGNTEYEVQVIATKTGASDGTPSDIVTATTDIEPPQSPTNLRATVGHEEVTLNWNAPSDASSITDYEYTSDDGVNWHSIGSTSTTVTVDSLTNGQQYIFMVRAVNSSGSGEPSNRIIAIPRGTPSAPQNLVATVGNALVTLNWDSPPDDGGNAISHYEYTIDGGTSWISTENLLTTHDVGELTNGDSYTFQVACSEL